MSETAFRAMCQRRQKEHETKTGALNIKPTATAMWCLVCKGKKRPDELELIPLAELQSQREQQGDEDMPGIVKHQKCASCGKLAKVSSCSGDFVCSSCAPLYGAVRKRPEAVLRAIKKLRPELLGQAVQDSGVTAQVESRALAEIARAVGFKGANGEALIATVAQVVIDRDEAWEQVELASMDRDRAVDILRRANCAMPDGEMEYEELPHRVAGLASKIDNLIEKHSLPDVTRALDCAAHDWDMAAIHTAALLDEAVSQRIQDHAQMGALGHAADRMREQIEALRADLARIKEEYTMTIDRMTDLEQIQVVNEQIFARLREILGSDGLDNGDIVGAVSGLVEALRGATRHRNGGQTALDGHLLDLVLEYPGIPLERIAMIREAV